jgi:Flp pilus assembly pilin Flp
MQKWKNDQSGTVTAEYAVLLPVVVFFIALVVFVGTLGTAQVKCTEAINNIMRVAVQHSNPEGASHRADYDNIVKQTLGQENFDKFTYNVQKIDAKWVKVEAKLQLEGTFASVAIKEVVSDVTGYIEK